MPRDDKQFAYSRVHEGWVLGDEIRPLGPAHVGCIGYGKNIGFNTNVDWN